MSDMNNTPILIIETDPETQVVLTELICDLGFRAEVENNVKRALLRLGDEHFPVVITDNHVNEYTGLDILKLFKKKDPLVQVIIVSGEATLDAAVTALNLGAHSFVEKPIGFAEMQLQIKQALAKRSFTLTSQSILDKTVTLPPPLLKHLHHLISLNQLGRRLINSMEYQYIIDSALRGLASMVKAESYSLLIVEGEEAQLHVRSEKPGFASHLGDIKDILLASWKELSQKQLQPEKLKIDFHTEHLEEQSGHPAVPFQSSLSVPLLFQAKVIGLLNISSTQSRAFDTDTSPLLTIVADYLSVVVANASRHRYTQLLASTDGLTGLFNYRTLHERLQHEFDRSKRYGSPLSFIMLDIDLFKKVNDAYGHTQGDIVLREVADILRASTRDVDLLARYGGDEFAVILPQTEARNGVLLAERIRVAVKEHSFHVSDTDIWLTISLGVATYPHSAVTSSKQLIDRADRALYEAKNSGHDKVTVAI